MSGVLERLAILVSLDSKGAAREIQAIGSAADRDLGKAQTRADQLGSTFLKTGALMVGAAGVITVGLVKLAGASEDANRSELLLDNTLERMPALAGANKQALLDLAAATQDKTAADGDQVVSAMAMLGTFRLTEDEMRRATPLVIDYARKFGIDLTAAAIQVGKAFEGNIGTLQRNGVFVDENVYKTDRFRAVIDALRENAGGFAEQEGATMSGRLQRLKNELGDVAEGVGSGVVDAFQTIMDVGEPVVGVMGSIDEATGGAIGKFATWATVGVGAAGTLTFIAGAGLKARESLKHVGGELPRTTAAIKGLAVAGTVVGGVFALKGAIDALGLGAEDFSYDVERLQANLKGSQSNARQTANEWLRVARSAAEMGAGVDSVDEAMRNLAQKSPETARMVVESADLEAATRRRLNGVIDEEISAKRRSADVAAVDAEASKGLAAAKEEEAQARRDATSAQQAEFSAHIAAQRALFDIADAQAEYNTAVGEHGTLSREAQEANLALQDSYLRRAEAVARSAQEDAKAAGATDSAAQGQLAYRVELERLMTTTAPGSPMRLYLQQLIRDLDLAGLPRNPKVTVHVDDSQLRAVGTVIDGIKTKLASLSNPVKFNFVPPRTGP